MIISDIQRFAEIRYQARAYLCYILERNLQNSLPEPLLRSIVSRLDKIAREVDSFDALYVIDAKGEQVIDNVSKKAEFILGKGFDRSYKAYFYRAVKEKRCVLTDPYPSSLTNDLCVTASFPLYDAAKTLRYVICIDISLRNILKISATTKLDRFAVTFSKIIYSIFSIALFIISLVVFFRGTENFIFSGLNLTTLNIEEMFKSTILLTLSLAIFDLVKTIFEEEVLGHSKKERGAVHKTMVRFLGSIVIALAIESLMLVFKFAAKEQTENILYAVYLLCGVTFLLIGLSVYMRLANGRKNKDRGGDR